MVHGVEALWMRLDAQVARGGETIARKRQRVKGVVKTRSVKALLSLQWRGRERDRTALRGRYCI